MGDLMSIHPFGNMMVIREYTGEQLWEALEHGVSDEGGKGPRLLQVAGLRYTVDASRPAGKRIVRAEVVDAKGKTAPLNLKGRYGVIVPEYLARGGDGYEVLKSGKVLPSPDPIDLDLVESYLRAHNPLARPAAGRIVYVNPGK
jgi:5'-nucleotidase/UDP-sugar diphosphatase